MKTVSVALLTALCCIAAQAGQTCVAQAAAQNLAGDDKASFLKKCTQDSIAVSRKVCDSQAAEKKLAGAAKGSFTKKCVNDMTPDVDATCQALADDKKLAGAARAANHKKCVNDSLTPTPPEAGRAASS